MDLLGSESSENEDDKTKSFTINESYAKSYDTWRKKEEKQKLIDRYGSDLDSSSSSEEEEIRSTVQMDKDWLRAYAVVHFKQPRLYKQGEKFFKETAKSVPLGKEKATTLKDHERKFMLEKGGIESDDEGKEIEPFKKSYFEEQEEIRNSFKDAVEESDEDSNEEEILVKKTKTTEEKEEDENEYLEWLKGNKDSLGDTEAEAELAPLKEYWSNPSLPEKEKVLRDYILNNGYMEKDDDEDSILDDEGPDHDEEEEFLEKAEEFEQKYNFRHEEPGADEIISYPRVIKDSVRAEKDTKRAEKRKKLKEQKKRLKEKRKEDLRLLKRLQEEDKEERLRKIRENAGNDEMEIDLDADFDPEQHDRMEKEYFHSLYDADNEVEKDEKPVFEYNPALDDEEDDWWQTRLKESKEEERRYLAGEEQEIDGEHDNTQEEYSETFNMDADYEPSTSTGRKKGKKKGRARNRRVPKFDPAKKSIDEYFDDILKDRIDTHVKYTYRQVMPVDFGLTTSEILDAKEKELNSWVSVKKMSQFRNENEEANEAQIYQSKSRNLDKKYKIMPSLKPQENDEEQKKEKNKTTNNKKRNKKPDLKYTADDTADKMSEIKVEINNDSETKKSPSKIDNIEEPESSKKENLEIKDKSQTNAPKQDVKNKPKKDKKKDNKAAEMEHPEEKNIDESKSENESKKRKHESSDLIGETSSHVNHVTQTSSKNKNKKMKMSEKRDLHEKSNSNLTVQSKKFKKNKFKPDDKSGSKYQSKLGRNKKLKKVMTLSRMSAFGFGADNSSNKKKKGNK